MQKWRMPWFLFENFVDATASYFLKVILFGCLAGTRIVVFRQIELDGWTDAQRRVGINLLHEYRPDRQSHGCALTHTHGIEVDIALLTTYPAATYELWSKADKPTVAVVVGSTGLRDGLDSSDGRYHSGRE